MKEVAFHTCCTDRSQFLENKLITFVVAYLTSDAMKRKNNNDDKISSFSFSHETMFFVVLFVSLFVVLFSWSVEIRLFPW